MRFGLCVAAAVAAVVGLDCATGDAFAAGLGFFPVRSHLVPLVVAATFVAPAAVAGVLSGLRHRGSGRGLVLAVSVLLVAGALVAFANPDLLTSIRV